MLIKSAEFIKSSPRLALCPEPVMPEYAFIGRSNVGKSSLINMIVGRKKLAMTSNTPGKTQLINYFLINDAWYLVDLPGYGFAKQSKKTRIRWEQMIKNYLSGRENLLTTFILIDSRHEPQASDMEFMDWMAGNDLPFVMLFTKTDKITANVKQKNLKKYAKTMQESWQELPPALTTSAVSGHGRKEVLDYIEDNNRPIKP